MFRRRPASLDENGSHPSAILFGAANAVIDEMVAEGAIAADERERICVAAYPRTPDETLAPFADGGSRVGLRLIDRSFLPLEDGGWRQYQADGDAAWRRGAPRFSARPLAPPLEMRSNKAAMRPRAACLPIASRRECAAASPPFWNRSPTWSRSCGSPKSEVGLWARGLPGIVERTWWA